MYSQYSLPRFAYSLQMVSALGVSFKIVNTVRR